MSWLSAWQQLAWMGVTVTFQPAISWVKARHSQPVTCASTNGAVGDIVIWVRSRNCGCLVTWFCYQLIAKPANKTATVPWPDPYEMCNFYDWAFNSIDWTILYDINYVLNKHRHEGQFGPKAISSKGMPRYNCSATLLNQSAVSIELLMSSCGTNTIWKHAISQLLCQFGKSALNAIGESIWNHS